MSVQEARVGDNAARVRMFGSDKLAAEVAKEKWDLVKVVATQPYNKHLKYGISFVAVTGPPKVVEPKTEKVTKIGAFQLKAEDEDDDEEKVERKTERKKTITKTAWWLPPGEDQPRNWCHVCDRVFRTKHGMEVHECLGGLGPYGGPPAPGPGPSPYPPYQDGPPAGANDGPGGPRSPYGPPLDVDKVKCFLYKCSLNNNSFRSQQRSMRPSPSLCLRLKLHHPRNNLQRKLCQIWWTSLLTRRMSRRRREARVTTLVMILQGNSEC